MNHGELKVPSPFGRPSSDTQNLVLSELSLFIPPQNIENKILGLQYIGARLQYIGAPKCYWLMEFVKKFRDRSFLNRKRVFANLRKKVRK